MKKIYIVGGGGFARECHITIIENISHGQTDISFGGFLGHNGNIVDCKSRQDLFLGDVANFKFEENDYCVIGVGVPEIRKRIFEDLTKIGVKLYNLISYDSKLSDYVEMGEGNIIRSSSFTTDIKIGDGNLFNGQGMVGHDCEIGNFNFFSPRTNVLGAVKVGSLNTIGTGSVLLPNCKIGDNNKIAPLSVVYKGCKNYTYMLGNPAMKVGNINQNKE